MTTHEPAQGPAASAEGRGLALGLLGYLTYALLKPEKFQ